jgi:septum site-determining protein MinC
MSIVTFKGTRDGLSITLGEGEWHTILNELATQLSRPKAQAFFRGARVLLETNGRALDVAQLEELIALLAQREMTLVSVLGEQRSQEAFRQVRAALTPPEAVVPDATPPAVAPPPVIPADGSAALLIQRTVRSGQKYRYAGTIIVLGDVNPGAELVADGDIIVWGKLRGVVHAGASGNENAMIGALALAPTQLRIGSHIARAPDEKRMTPTPAEIARVKFGQIVVEPWNG